MNDDRETVTGKYNTIYYEDLPTVTEIIDTETTLPTRSSHTPSTDSHGKTFKYKPYPSPGSVKSMPQKQSNLELTDNSESEKNGKVMTTISAVTNTPSSQFTEAMKKFTYSLRTTASPLPAYLLRDQLPETPTSYYEYSDTRTGLPQVKSLPRLVQGYPPAPPRSKVYMSNLVVNCATNLFSPISIWY